MWKLKFLIAAVTVTSIFAAGWLLYARGMAAGKAQVQALWNADRLAMADAMNAELTKAKERETAITTQMIRLSNEHTYEINRIHRRHSAAIDSLRNRPETRSGDGGLPEGANAGVGCTGEGLARPDAGFLAGYAADAARLQAALNTCIAAYNQLVTQP